MKFKIRLELKYSSITEPILYFFHNFDLLAFFSKNTVNNGK